MLTHLNYLAIGAATLVYFVIGSLWFSALFGKVWLKLVNVTMTDEDKKKVPLMFATTFVLNFVICFATACVMHMVFHPGILTAIKIGLLLGLGFVAAPCAMNYMYAQRPVKLMAIEAGYHVFSILIASVILLMWR